MKKIILTFSTLFLFIAKGFSWTPAEMMQMKNISNIQWAPDNKSLLFVVTQVVQKDSKAIFLPRIYKADVSNTPEVTPFSSPDFPSFLPKYSPDGKWIAFLTNRTGVNNLYLVSSDGGEAIALTNVKNDIHTFSWSPNSQKIAFVMPEEKLLITSTETSVGKQYRKLTVVNRLWLLDISSPAPQALTSDEYCVRQNDAIDWSRDGHSIIFAFSPSIECDDYYFNSSIATINLSSKLITPWKKSARFEGSPRYSPDGHMVAYVSDDSPEKIACNHQISVAFADGTGTKVLAQTWNEGIFFIGANFLGWSHSGKEVLFYEPKKTKFHLQFLPIDGAAPCEVESGEYLINEPVMSPDRNMIAFVAQTPATPPELFVTSLEHFNPIKISSLNTVFTLQPQIQTKTVQWKSEDGLQIEGLLTYPINYQPEKLYPLLLITHGGPMGFFNEKFVGNPDPYPVAAFAENGFFILRPNPRGSTGYGKQFRCANYGDWGGMDFADIMTGVDNLISKKLVNPKKLGIMGWSYGGYMTAWTIGQTTRFQAASIGAGMTNLVSMNGTTDLRSFLPDYLGEYYENPELYANLSPINYVTNVTTPCLIQHGTEDKRVPISQAYEFCHALERIGKEPKLIVYNGMDHYFLDPEALLDIMNYNLNWFKEHLQKE